MMLIHAIVGFALLTLGYRLFWLFVAVAGFIAGSSLVEQIGMNWSFWARFGAALAFGVAGILLALLAQRLAIAIAGFVLGTYGLASLFLMFGVHSSLWGWVALIAGGGAGALLAYYVFNLALIVLSSLVGSMMVVGSLPVDATFRLLGFVVLGVFGLLFQSYQWRRSDETSI